MKQSTAPTTPIHLTNAQINELIEAGHCTSWENDDFTSAIKALFEAKEALSKPETLLSRYLKNPGHCPVCQDSAIEGDEVVIDANRATQEVSCTECSAEWIDEYRLASIDAEGFDPESTDTN